jgi:hypothetical protein
MCCFLSRQSPRLSSFKSSPQSSFQLVFVVRSMQPVRFYEPSDLWLAASRLNISASGRRPVHLHLPNFGVVIQLSAGRLLAASARLASSGSFLSRPSTCPALSFLSVIALMFPVRPKSFISALTVYSLCPAVSFIVCRFFFHIVCGCTHTFLHACSTQSFREHACVHASA